MFNFFSRTFLLQLFEQIMENQNISFLPLNIFCCPRFYKGLIVADGRSPLSKYTAKISALNCTKIIHDDTPQKDQISNFQTSDGLMYYLGKLAKRRKEGGYNFKGIKVLICICMYNESRHAIQTTLEGIYSNLQPLKENGISEQDIAVVLIQDGILKLVKDRVRRTYSKDEHSMISFYRQLDKIQGKEKCFLEQRINIILDEMQNFERKRMTDFVKNNNDFPPSIQKNLSFVYQNYWKPTPEDKFRLKIISCFKHTNGTKLSSHLWFFQGFCRQFNPQICILLDVGTKPSNLGILKYLEAFTDPNVGGVTGFMSVDAEFQSQQGQQQEQSQNFLTKCFFSVEKAQQFEYIISHFLDKSVQSSLGFLHVLPGAWSGYRYQALIHGQKFQQNLLQRKYFKMILDPSHEQRDYKEANMYLAEDRILSLGIYCQQDRKFFLQYVPDAIAYTDPMKSHEQLMIQRRRWINSSYFAFLYVFRNYYYNAMESSHNFMRKYILLSFSMFLALLSFINGYLIPSFYVFALYTTIVQSGSNYVIQYAAELLTLIYIFMILLCITWSLYGTWWTKQAHVISFIFSFYTFMLMALVIYNVVGVYLELKGISSFGQIFNDPQGGLVFVITCINVASYVIIAIIHLPTHCTFVFKLLTDCISYLAYQGAYSHVMLIYAFCNVDNVSWGTKGNNGKRISGYLIEKVSFIADWLLYNALLAFIFLYIDFFMPRQTKKGIVLLAIGVYASIIMLIKVILATYHHLKWIFTERCCRKLKEETGRNQNLQRFWKDMRKEYTELKDKKK